MVGTCFTFYLSMTPPCRETIPLSALRHTGIDVSIVVLNDLLLGDVVSLIAVLSQMLCRFARVALQSKFLDAIVEEVVIA